MAQPTAYNKTTNFTNYATANPSATYNAADHDTEFDNIETTLDETLTNLALIQRDDGLLANASVHPDAFTAESLALMGGSWSPEGLWVTATEYAVGDVVENSGNSYVCAEAHTSGTFATDHTAGKWIALSANVTTISPTDSGFSITGSVDTSKVAKFEVDTNITASTTRTFTFPNVNGTLATINNAQSFTAAQTFATNVTLGDTDGADTLTLAAATWTISNNYTATRAAGTVATGTVNLQQWATSFTGDSGGATSVRGHLDTLTIQGANAVAGGVSKLIRATHAGSATLTNQSAVLGSIFSSSSGNTTGASNFSTELSLSGGATIGTLVGLVVNAPTISSGSITTNYGVLVNNIGSASVTTATAFKINDFTNSTNMRGLHSSLSSGTGKYNLYIDGSAQNYIAGTLTVGTTTATGALISTSVTLSGTGQEYGTFSATTVNSTSGSGEKYAIQSQISAGAGYAASGGLTAFNGIINQSQAVTTGSMQSFNAQVVITAAATITAINAINVSAASNSGGATVTTFTGLRIAAQTVGSTIYGIRSLIGAASQRYNLYIDGTAQNYIAGQTGIGLTATNNIFFEVGGTYTSGGVGTTAVGAAFVNVITGANGDTGGIFQVQVGGGSSGLTTQGNSETIAIAAGLRIIEPNLTKGTGDTITTAATVYIDSAPTEGSTNAALYVASGNTYLGGSVGIGTTAGFGFNHVSIAGTLTSDGGSNKACMLSVGGALTGASGDTAYLTKFEVTGGSLTTQANDTVAVVAAAYFTEPTITIGSAGTASIASTVYIASAPTEGSTNAALYVASGAAMLLGTCYIGDTANAGVTLGLTINQGAADNNILCLKSSDVTHAFTTGISGTTAETDDYLVVNKVNATGGGARLTAVNENDANQVIFQVQAYGGTADTTKTTAGRGMIELRCAEHDGANAVNDVTADGILFNVAGYTGGFLTRFMVDEDGDLFADGGTSTTAVTVYDDYDDAKLIRAFSRAVNPKGVIRGKWDEFIRYNEQTLVEAGILGAPLKDKPLYCVTRLQQLQNGAIWQHEERLNDHEEQIKDLLAERTALTARLAQIERRLTQ